MVFDQACWVFGASAPGGAVSEVHGRISSNCSGPEKEQPGKSVPCLHDLLSKDVRIKMCKRTAAWARGGDRARHTHVQTFKWRMRVTRDIDDVRDAQTVQKLPILRLRPIAYAQAPLDHLQNGTVVSASQHITTL